MRAIMTKILPATNSRPTRLVAQVGETCNPYPRCLRIVVSYDSLQDGRLTDEQVHGKLAMRLAQSLSWISPANYLIGGCINAGKYVFVFSDSTIIPDKEGEPS